MLTFKLFCVPDGVKKVVHFIISRILRHISVLNERVCVSVFKDFYLSFESTLLLKNFKRNVSVQDR